MAAKRARAQADARQPPCAPMDITATVPSPQRISRLCSRPLSNEPAGPVRDPVPHRQQRLAVGRSCCGDGLHDRAGGDVKPPTSCTGSNPAAPRAGFEPAAYSLGGSRSVQLSYRGRTRDACAAVDSRPVPTVRPSSASTASPIARRCPTAGTTAARRRCFLHGYPDLLVPVAERAAGGAPTPATARSRPTCPGFGDSPPDLPGHLGAADRERRALPPRARPRARGARGARLGRADRPALGVRSPRRRRARS